MSVDRGLVRQLAIFIMGTSIEIAPIITLIERLMRPRMAKTVRLGGSFGIHAIIHRAVIHLIYLSEHTKIIRPI